MTRRYTASQLTERDHQILYWTGHAGIASLAQLARHFWSGKQESTAGTRLTQLVKAGYLDAEFCRTDVPWEPVYSLTRKGWLLFKPPMRDRLHIGLPAHAARKQQLLSQEAHLWLGTTAEAAGGCLTDWRTEHELRAAWYRKHERFAHNLLPDEEIPDAQAVIVAPDGARREIDIEIDGQYFGASLWGKAARIGRQSRPTLWICSAPRADYLRGVLHDYPNIRVVVL
jgi:hypothetical protein